MMINKTKWTSLEDNLIMSLKKQKVPYIEIAEQVNRTVDATRNRLWELRVKGNLEKVNNINDELLNSRLGFLDVETNGFSANYNFMLSWSIKIGDEIYSDVIRKNEVANCTFDKRILKSLVKTITDKIDIIITYYGDRFDVPFIRSRCDFWGIPFFKYGEKYSWDLYFLVKSKLKLSSRSLDSVCAHYGIEGKTHLDPATWQRASAGNKESLDNVLEHNKFDVEILQQLFERMKDYKQWTRKSV